MLETCDRNAEKDGTVILESELVFRGACVWLCERTTGAGGGTEASVLDDAAECE
jgi:hypothetical protein